MSEKKILLVDDDQDFAQLLEFDFKKKGYQVVTANNGEDGLAKAMSEKPNLIILDVVMPHMDGYTLVQEIKRHDDLRKTPIIVITAKTDMQDIFLNEGVSCCMIKPFKTEEFLQNVKQLAQQ